MMLSRSSTLEHNDKHISTQHKTSFQFFISRRICNLCYQDVAVKLRAGSLTETDKHEIIQKISHINAEIRAVILMD